MQRFNSLQVTMAC